MSAYVYLEGGAEVRWMYETFTSFLATGDPARLFNPSLDGNVRRAIDIREGEEVDEATFEALVRQAVALTSARTSKSSLKRTS